MSYRLGVDVGGTVTDPSVRNRAPLPLFDDGPDTKTLRADCAAETGLPASREPVWHYADAAG